MLVTLTQIQVTLDRHQDLRAAIARDCLIAATSQPTLSTTPRLESRIRARLRYVVASLVALASIV